MNSVVRITDTNDYLSRFEDQQRELAKSAETAGRSFSQGMADLVQMQQAEILRLHNVLRDNTTIPERHAVDAHIASASGKDGRVEHSLLVIANDRSLWILQHFHPNMRPQDVRWFRVPQLPQAADEIEPRR